MERNGQVHDDGAAFLVSGLTGGFVGFRTDVQAVTNREIPAIAGNRTRIIQNIATHFTDYPRSLRDSITY
jgi:hypothetical protein